MKFVVLVLAILLAIISPAFACEGASKASESRSAETVLAKTVFNRITPETMEIDAAAKKAYGCRYIFADVFGGLERAIPIAGGLPIAPAGTDGKAMTGKVVVAYIITTGGVAADPLVIESSNPELTSVALTAMQEWRFRPVVFNGRVVASMAAQEFPFGSIAP